MALPNTSEVSFTIVLAVSDVATFSVALPTNSPVSVMAPLIDCDASSCGDWPSTKSKVTLDVVNITPKINVIPMAVGILLPILILLLYL